MELAQIYCKPGLPENKCCKRFFQLTDKMAAKNLLKGEPMGAVIEPDTQSKADSEHTTEQEKKSFYDFFRRHNWASFFLAQECLWGVANWKSKALETFVDDFHPDVIVAPLCYSRYVMAIQRWVAERLKKPMVGIIWDDLYSLNERHISPIYWLNRFLQRRSVEKTVKMCSRLYTLSPQQAEAFQQQFDRPFGVLPKVGVQQEETTAPADTVRFLYAGGIYYGRKDTLAQIAETLARLNQQGYPCRLDVYTNSPDAQSLEAYGACYVHAAVPAQELRQLYAASHVALHVEGFERSFAQKTRLSFSSKIVDCLSSGCAVLAVCPEGNCGFRYLIAQDAALCVDNRNDIADTLFSLVKNPEEIKYWQKKALQCATEKHESSRVRMLIREELESLSES